MLRDQVETGLMDVREAAAYMRRSRDWIKRKVASGELPSAKDTGRTSKRWIRKADCDAYIAARMTPTISAPSTSRPRRRQRSAPAA